MDEYDVLSRITALSRSLREARERNWMVIYSVEYAMQHNRLNVLLTEWERVRG